MKKYTKEKMSELLNSLGCHLSDYTGEFPGVSAAVLALSEAAKDPHKTAESVKVAAKVRSAPKVKSVALDYSGENLLVKGVPWGQIGLALKESFNQLVGKRSKRVDPNTGEPYFLTCYDKKTKSFKLPKEKEAEVRACLKDAGLSVATN